MLHLCGMLKQNSGVSLLQASSVMVLRQVRKGTSSSPSALKGIYPCIIPEKPIASSLVSVTPYRFRTSSVRLL